MIELQLQPRIIFINMINLLAPADNGLMELW